MSKKYKIKKYGKANERMAQGTISLVYDTTVDTQSL